MCGLEEIVGDRGRVADQGQVPCVRVQVGTGSRNATWTPASLMPCCPGVNTAGWAASLVGGADTDPVDERLDRLPPGWYGGVAAAAGLGLPACLLTGMRMPPATSRIARSTTRRGRAVAECGQTGMERDGTHTVVTTCRAGRSARVRALGEVEVIDTGSRRRLLVGAIALAVVFGAAASDAVAPARQIAGPAPIGDTASWRPAIAELLQRRAAAVVHHDEAAFMADVSLHDATVAQGQRDEVGSSRVDLQACKLEYSIVSPK